MKAHLGFAGVLVAAAVLGAPSSAEAAGHANGFGEKGQLILSADRLVPLFSYTYSSVTDTQNNIELTTSRSGTGLSLLLGRDLAHVEDFNVPVNVHSIPRVAFDITVIPRLTLGAAFAFGFGLGGTNADDSLAGGGAVTTRKVDAPTATAIGLVPRVGYIIPLSDIFAFWPRLGFGFYSVSGTTEQNLNNGGVQTTRLTDTMFSVDVDPQFVIVPIEHFFIHMGPLINIPLSGKRSLSQTVGARTDERSVDTSLFHVGLHAGIGGWLNVF